MTREEVKEAMNSFLKKGGKITKLPDGPNYSFNPYGVRVVHNAVVDLTATEDPSTKKQRKAFETNTL